MSDLPQPSSYETILGNMLSSYASSVGIDDFNVGSLVTSLFEVVALSTARASGDIFQILTDFSVDRATGNALQQLAIENGITPVQEQPATGFVNVIDTSFTKISTQIYAGTNPPNVGSVTINVSNASSFTATGSVYLGRGTPNVEGPIAYSSITPTGNYYTINLNSPTTKYHNVGESVILSQGGVRTVPINTIVFSPGIGSTANIQYSVTATATILDGETEVDSVPITALIPGSTGNVPIGSITQFSSPPFNGAIVTNPLPLTTGIDTQTDDQLRTQIKLALASTGLGTATAIQSALINATATDVNDTITSASVLISPTTGSATVYIDDGTGYEETWSGVGLESIVNSAIGGEQFFQLATGGTQAPVAKALLESTVAAPFDLIGGDTLALIVGETTYQHVFVTSDFVSPGGATAYEVTASVNRDTTLGFEALTADGGTYVYFRAIAETDDSIQTTIPTTNGRNAATLLGLPSNKINTLNLYKNNQPLTKDGDVAVVFSQDQQLWSPSIENGDTLILAVDGTASITYTITNAAFIATGLYTSIASTNSLASWVQVLNGLLTGVTVAVVGEQLSITSNLGTSSRAQVVIDPSSTLVTKAMFSSSLGLSSQGKTSDFTLDRNTAQFQLAVPLVAGDQLQAGSTETQATITSGAISAGNVTFTSDAHAWILIDNSGQIIPTGVINGTVLTISQPSANVVRYTSSISGAFSNVDTGDYVIIWSTDVNANNDIEGRVYAVSSTTLDILITPTEYAAIVPQSVTFTAGFIVLRSSRAPQKFKVAAGTYTLDQISQALQAQTQELIFSVFQEQNLVVRTETTNTSGSVMVVTTDASGQLMNWPTVTLSKSQTSLLAFYDSQEYEGDMPLFIHSTFSNNTYANPIDSYINSFTSTVSLAGRDPNELISILHPYGIVRDAQPYGEAVQESSISGSTIDIVDESDIRRLRSVDRFFVASPLDFGNNDNFTVILDNNPTNESFTVPLFRNALTNTTFATSSTAFNAYDTAYGPSGSFASSFGSTFDFSNYKALMQAKKVLTGNTLGMQSSLLYRAAEWGRTGEYIYVGYTYPTGPNLSIGSTVSVTSQIDINISLKSGTAIPTSIDATTEWNITVTPNTPSSGIDQVTYTYSGTGTAPALSLSSGEYVNITIQTEFNVANTGLFSISSVIAPSSNSFTVQAPHGVAAPQSNVATQVNGAITFYNSSTTTAAAINTYVNANLSQYISGTIVNDSGMSGSGVISLSTYENSGFAYANVQLQDGINWIASSNLSGSPQFTFKVPLSLPTDTGYAFNNGENVILTPTTMAQVDNFISILPVSGFTTDGTVNLSDRGSQLELATDTVGSGGAIQIVGGSGNSYSFPVLFSATRLDNTYMQISANNIASASTLSDQWFKLQAASAQDKDALFSTNTNITIASNVPTTGQSTITMLNRELTQRYFGLPRNFVRSESDTFRIEKQGDLVCLSWNPNIGTNPNFMATLNFNDSGGGTLNVSKVSSDDAQYIILSGNANFTELSIGDLLSVSGLPNSANNGTFLVTGVSTDGTIVEVLNPDAANEFSYGTFTFTGNPNAGDSFVIGSSTLIAGTNFAIGGSAAITAANFSAVAGTIPGVTSSFDGVSIVTITATTASANIAISYTPFSTTEVTVSGSYVAGVPFVAGQFTASSQVSEGDTMILSAPFNVLNQGQFRIIRMYSNSVWFVNPDVVEEEVNLPYNPINLEFDGTTSFNISAADHTIYLTWNGTGKEPHLENAYVGDIVTFGTDFSSANQGSFMVRNSGPQLQEIVELTVPSGGQFTVSGVGTYFTINSALNANRYYAWFNVNNSNTDPAPFGLTGLQVNILSGDNSTQVATKLAAVLNVATGLSATSSTNTVTVTTIGYGTITDPANVSVPIPFSIEILQEGQATFLECINPAAVNQSSIVITNILDCHRPQMQFYEYEATVPGDQFVISGSFLGTSNAGTYPIARVVNQDTAIVTGSLGSVFSVSMAGNETSAFVLEGVPYSGYKQVYLIASQPASTILNYITFDTNAQYEKINQAASVQLTSLNKLNFNTTLQIGIDSYKYNTGLVALANRIIYGDPRDPITYPGVGAAGAEIFVQGPLTLRLQLSIDVRLNTGVPFTQIVTQVQSAVSSLINANPVGQSIAISSIISAVSVIPGVLAVSISSPSYSPNNDLIVVTPSQKTRIIDPATDIFVSQIGT